jgi:hypothetical protein
MRVSFVTAPPVVVFGVLTIAALYGSEHQSVPDRSEISPWPTTVEAARRIPRQKVVDFICRSGIRSVSSPFDIQEFRFASLAAGKIHLLAAVQGGGTIGVNLIFVAHCDGHRCSQDFVSADPPIELDRLLVSARNDGVHQLLTTHGWSFDTGLHTLGSWQMYEQGASRLENVTSKYQDWLYARLQRLANKALAKAVGPTQRQMLRAQADFALAQFTDKMGMTREALLKYSEKWSHSDLNEVKKLAALAREWSPDIRLGQEALEFSGKTTENTATSGERSQ